MVWNKFTNGKHIFSSFTRLVRAFSWSNWNGWLNWWMISFNWYFRCCSLVSIDDIYYLKQVHCYMIIHRQVLWLDNWNSIAGPLSNDNGCAPICRNVKWRWATNNSGFIRQCTSLSPLIIKILANKCAIYSKYILSTILSLLMESPDKSLGNLIKHLYSELIYRNG